MAIGAALGMLASGCGGAEQSSTTTSATSSPVSADDQDCRDTWQGLAGQVDAAYGNIRGATARAFATRWTSLSSGVAYYAATARAQDCGSLLRADQDDLRLLKTVSVRGRPFDIEWRRAALLDARKRWLAAQPGAREPAAVRSAYAVLDRRYAAADRAVSPALTALAEADPADSRAIRRAVADLTLLAGASDTWLTCDRALVKAKRFLAASTRTKEKAGR